MSREKIVVQDNSKNDIIITNIKFDPTRKYNSNAGEYDLPTDLTLSVPKNLLEISNEKDFEDNLESFVYQFLSRTYGYMCCYCQIWRA